MRVLSFVLAMGLCALANGGSLSDSLVQKLSSQGKSDAVLELPSVMGKVLSNPILNMMPKGNARTEMMTGLMKQMTSASQAPFMSAIQSLGIAESAQPFWISNTISMKNVDLSAVKQLNAIPGAFSIREPFQVKLHQPIEGNFTIKADGDVKWGIQRIGAPSVWDATDKGEGMLVGSIDTGVMLEHEALSGNYGGFWHDSIDGREEPYDDNGHGTHTVGTMVGQTNGIGVAPNAKWVACKGLGNNGGSEVTLRECAQWILSLETKPQVVCNSWGSDRGGQTWFNDEVTAWNQAGITPVFALGNAGPRCGTAGSPGDQPNMISVGATTSADVIARFSSRGKPKRGETVKPEVCAPGQDIESAWIDGGYRSLQGTSMAAPHVAGAVALMKKALGTELSLKDITTRLTKTAFQTKKLTKEDSKCGKVGNGNWPNYVYGFGRIDISKAIQ